jgi:hypothetical protein
MFVLGCWCWFLCRCQVVNHSMCPVWNEGFTWLFDVAPKGQKLYIVCKSKNTFGKVWTYGLYIFHMCFRFRGSCLQSLHHFSISAVDPRKSHHPNRQSGHWRCVQRVLQPQPWRRQGWLENTRDRDHMVKQAIQRQHVARPFLGNANRVLLSFM